MAIIVVNVNIGFTLVETVYVIIKSRPKFNARIVNPLCNSPNVCVYFHDLITSILHSITLTILQCHIMFLIFFALARNVI